VAAGYRVRYCSLEMTALALVQRTAIAYKISGKRMRTANEDGSGHPLRFLPPYKLGAKFDTLQKHSPLSRFSRVTRENL
jgi:hypothetical protein